MTKTAWSELDICNAGSQRSPLDATGEGVVRDDVPMAGIHAVYRDLQHLGFIIHMASPDSLSKACNSFAVLPRLLEILDKLDAAITTINES